MRSIHESSMSLSCPLHQSYREIVFRQFMISYHTDTQYKSIFKYMSNKCKSTQNVRSVSIHCIRDLGACKLQSSDLAIKGATEYVSHKSPLPSQTRTSFDNHLLYKYKRKKRTLGMQKPEHLSRYAH